MGSRSPRRGSLGPRTRWLLLAGLLAALVLAGVVSYIASTAPDGLERVAADTGIAERAREHPLSGSPLDGYGVGGVEDGQVSVGLAGVAGVAVTLAVAAGGFWLLRRAGRAAGRGAGAGTGGDDGRGPGGTSG